MEQNLDKNKTNIGFWEQILNAPTPAYKELFDEEKKYLSENIKEDSFVLDIGCGEGRNMAFIFEKTPHVYGIDNDPQAVKEAQEHFKDQKDVQVFYAEAEKLPFENETFDTVTFLMILPNLENNKEASMIESARVLKKDGELILSTFAETAFDERMKVYKAFNLPIVAVEGTKVIFDKSVGAHTSEQFSLEQLSELGKKAGLIIKKHQKVGDIAYLCTFQKVADGQ